MSLTPRLLVVVTNRAIRNAKDTGVGKYEKYTLQDLYDTFIHGNYFSSLSKSGQGAHRSAWTHLSSISQVLVSNITKETFQHPIDALQKSGKKRDTLAKVRNLCSLLCQEAMKMGLLVTNYGKLVQLPRNDCSRALPFSSSELNQIGLKADSGDLTAASVLILIYTGMRPSELLSLEISTHINYHGTRMYFKAGSKYADIQKRRNIDPEIMMEIMGHEDFSTTVEFYHTTTYEDSDRIFCS